MPSEATVDKALAAIKQPASYEYFFDRLSSPAWIASLRKRGFFRHPPKGEIEENYIRFPFWPESRYLARMASDEPELVLDVLEDIPDTDNPRVLNDILDALLEMPPSISIKMATRAISWLSSPYLFTAPEKLGRLAVRLAEADYVSAALMMAKELLLPASGDIKTEGNRGRNVFDAKPRYEMWSYERVAQSIVPSIAALEPMRVIRLLMDVLEAVVRLNAPTAEAPDDGSSFWRPAIENSDQNSPIKEVSDVVIEALRDATNAYVRSDPSMLSEITTVLLERRWSIFRRVSYYLFTENLDTSWPLARAEVFNSSNFSDLNVYHEFWLLARPLPRGSSLKSNLS